MLQVNKIFENDKNHLARPEFRTSFFFFFLLVKDEALREFLLKSQKIPRIYERDYVACYRIRAEEVNVTNEYDLIFFIENIMYPIVIFYAIRSEFSATK